MDIEIDNNFWIILKKEFRHFKSYLKDYDEEQFLNYNEGEFECLFLYSIVNDTPVMKKIKKKLMDNGFEEKYINKLFYTVMKYKHKVVNKMWSWNEIEDYNIPLDMIEKTTTKFCFI